MKGLKELMLLVSNNTEAGCYDGSGARRQSGYRPRRIRLISSRLMSKKREYSKYRYSSSYCFS
jgi:hypothetical protein